MISQAAKAEGGGLGKFFTYTNPLMVLGAVPGIGGLLRKNLPGGEILAPSLTGRRSGDTATYLDSRRLAKGVQNAGNVVKLPTSGPTQRGIKVEDAFGNPVEGIRKAAFGNSEKDLKAAHKIRTKLASPRVLQNLDPRHIAALAIAGTAATTMADHLLGGALNRLEGARRDIKRQSKEKRTMGILGRVNPMVAEDPDTRAKARVLYGIVHRNSPYIAGEPVVAASVINSMLHSPTELPTVDMFQQIAKIQKDTEAARERSPFGRGGLTSPSKESLVSAVYGDDDA